MITISDEDGEPRHGSLLGDLYGVVLADLEDAEGRERRRRAREMASGSDEGKSDDGD